MLRQSCAPDPAPSAALFLLAGQRSYVRIMRAEEGGPGTQLSLCMDDADMPMPPYTCTYDQPVRAGAAHIIAIRMRVRTWERWCWELHRWTPLRRKEQTPEGSEEESEMVCCKS